jgi:hypothetical protein
MTTMNVLDASGATVAIEKPLTPGRAAAASSRPVALSNEDNTTLNAISTSATAIAGSTAAAATSAAAIGSAPTATARLPSSAASVNAANVKGSAGRVFQLSGKNNAAYDVFLVLYDSAVNPPVPGTTTIRKKMICPAGQAFVYDAAAGGMVFATGIGYAFTKLVADADTTALAAADITAFNMDYA